MVSGELGEGCVGLLIGGKGVSVEERMFGMRRISSVGKWI